jgi:thiamine biosynthesis protein ThiS
MRVFVNGAARELDEGTTGGQLLASLQLNAATLVVELNGQVVKTTEFLERTLVEGDNVELVTVVGGG